MHISLKILWKTELGTTYFFEKYQATSIYAVFFLISQEGAAKISISSEYFHSPSPQLLLADLVGNCAASDHSGLKSNSIHQLAQS